MSPSSNIHATGLVIGDRGLLLTGESGSGKTTLALFLMDDAKRDGRFAALIADDQLFASAHGGALVCSPPPSIAGLVEVCGAAPRAVPFISQVVADLVIQLVPAEDAPRFSEAQTIEIAGCMLPVLRLGRRNVIGALSAIRAALGHAPFVQNDAAVRNIGVQRSVLGLSTHVASTR